MHSGIIQNTNDYKQLFAWHHSLGNATIRDRITETSHFQQTVETSYWHSKNNLQSSSPSACLLPLPLLNAVHCRSVLAALLPVRPASICRASAAPMPWPERRCADRCRTCCSQYGQGCFGGDPVAAAAASLFGRRSPRSECARLMWSGRSTKVLPGHLAQGYLEDRS